MKAPIGKFAYLQMIYVLFVSIWHSKWIWHNSKTDMIYYSTGVWGWKINRFIKCKPSVNGKFYFYYLSEFILACWFDFPFLWFVEIRIGFVEIPRKIDSGCSACIYPRINRLLTHDMPCTVFENTPVVGSWVVHRILSAVCACIISM